MRIKMNRQRDLYDFIYKISETEMKVDWKNTTKVHDWRNHIPYFIQEAWETFSEEQQEVFKRWAEELADREEWE
jgi:hypothetical protein